MSEQSASELRTRAAWCLTLANSISDTRTRDILNRSAEEFEKEASARAAFEAARSECEDHRPG